MRINLNFAGEKTPMKRIQSLILLLFISTSTLMAAEKLSTEALLQNLKNSDPGVREKAAKELGDRGEKLGMDALIDATSDPDQRVQMAVVRAIANIPDPRQVTGLCQAVRNTQGKAQKEAIHLLTQHYVPSKDNNALQELWDSLESLFNPPHPIVAEPGIRVDDEAVDALIFVLDDKNSENRLEAAATLGILRAERGLPRLKFYLQSPNEQMARTCVRSIGYIGNTEAGADLIPLLKHQDENVALDASRVLGQFRYKPALPELQEFLDYRRDKDHRRVILQAISRIGDPSSEPVMTKYVNDDDKEMRQYAIEGFGRMGLVQYKDSLAKQFQREESKQIKLALCFSLFALGERAYIDTLVLSIDERGYRDQVREYFVELGDRAIPEFTPYLQSGDKQTKLKIIRLLGDMHRPDGIPVLEPYLKHPDMEIAQAATDSIRELKRINS